MGSSPAHFPQRASRLGSVSLKLQGRALTNTATVAAKESHIECFRGLLVHGAIICGGNFSGESDLMETDFGLEHVGLLGVVSKEEEDWEKWELEQREKWERGEYDEQQEGVDGAWPTIEDKSVPEAEENAKKKKKPDMPRPRSKKESRDTGVS